MPQSTEQLATKKCPRRQTASLPVDDLQPRRHPYLPLAAGTDAAAFVTTTPSDKAPYPRILAVAGQVCPHSAGTQKRGLSQGLGLGALVL